MLLVEQTSDTERVTWSLRPDKDHKIKVMTETLVDGEWVQLALKGRDFSQPNPHPRFDTDDQGVITPNILHAEWESSKNAVADLTGVAVFLAVIVLGMMLITAVSVVLP